MSVTGIVLAGGRSTRFGSDKLLEPVEQLHGETLLVAAIDGVAALSDGVIVAGRALPEALIAGDVPIALVRDPEPFGGPLVALAHVLGTAAADPDDLAIVTGGDMPRLVPAVIEAMLETLRDSAGADAVHLGRDEASTGSNRSEPSRRQVLPLVIRVQPAARAAREAVEAGHRSLQALLDRMTAIELPSTAWLPLDPGALTLLDVDTRADLDRLRPS